MRSRPYLIEEVVHPPEPGQDTLVRLSCLADDAQGERLDDRRKKRKVVPVRFVQGCPNGHISDLRWYSFVHNDYQDSCRG